MAVKKATERRKDYAQLNDIGGRIDELFAVLNEMKQIEAARAERERVLSEKVAQLDGAINGNGKPGMKTDLRIAQEQITRASVIGGMVTAAIIADIASRILIR